MTPTLTDVLADLIEDTICVLPLSDGQISDAADHVAAAIAPVIEAARAEAVRGFADEVEARCSPTVRWTSIPKRSSSCRERRPDDE